MELIINFIPDWVAAVVLALALAILVVGAIATWLIPAQIRVPAQALAILVLVISAALVGAQYNERSWAIRVAEQQAEIARLQAASAEITAKVVTRYIDRTRVVKENSDAVIREIPVYITPEADAACTITAAAVLLHDAAAANQVPDAARLAHAGAASNITLSRLLDTTVTNYGTFYEVREQLRALQDWVREQHKLNP